MKNSIYLDNAATTKIDQVVYQEMQPYLLDCYGNPSSPYTLAAKSKKALNEARAVVADMIGAQRKEIFFTSGGTESDNWALIGVALAAKKQGNHIITSKVEHYAILKTCEYLEKLGYEITYLDVDDQGMVDPSLLEAAIRPTTILISVIFANNEIGTIQPIKEIGLIAKQHRIIFHSDAVQAYGHLPIDVNEYGLDLLSASGHKIHGPKGVGLLYVRRGVAIDPFIHGGTQEGGFRAGTENLPAIVGFAKATELAKFDMSGRMAKVASLRDYLVSRILTEIPHTQLNGSTTSRLPNNANISFDYIQSESLLMMLDQKGIMASNGSACTSDKIGYSHVLEAIKTPENKAFGSVRFTLCHENTEAEIDTVVAELKIMVERLRIMSPLYPGS